MNVLRRTLPFRFLSTGAAELAALSELALAGGGASRIARQHAAGKLTARERIEAFLDRGTFRELQQLSGAGVVSGRGLVNGRPVHLYAQDFTVGGGSVTKSHAAKVCATMDAAAVARTPIVALCDSGGARIQEGVGALAGYTEIFRRNVALSGTIPQVSVIAGPCAGGAVYSPALTDFVVVVRGAFMFLTGPDVVRSVTKEEISRDALGGADAHARKSGVSHLTARDDLHALALTRELLAYLPDSWKSNAHAPGRLLHGTDPHDRNDLALARVLPPDGGAYDIRDVVWRVVDDGEFLELQPEYAQNIVTAFARMGGATVGIVANQPCARAGVLDCDASCKAARFVRFCDAFEIPLLTFVDVPGFMPGSDQEHGGVIRHGAKLLYAYAEATCPKVTLITRKAYGGAYCVMSSKHLKGDFNFAWPSAEIAVMGARGAAEILARGKSEGEVKRYEEEYAKTHATAVAAAQSGYLDAIVNPQETRQALVEAVLSLIGRKKRPEVRDKKHGCIPL